MGWKSKLLLDTLKAFLPFQGTLRRLKRRLFPHQKEPENNGLAFEQGLKMLGMLRRAGVNLHEQTVLELGSGWQPVIPILFYLAGCRKIILTDLEYLTDETLVRMAARFVASRTAQIAAEIRLTEGEVQQRLDFLGSGTLEDILERLNMEYRVPFESRSVASSSIDIIISRTVLEHIKPRTIASILRDFQRVLRPEGYMCHVIDMSDHFEHRDKLISRVNFLKFGELVWALTGLNPQNYQNRLRHFEFIEMFQSAGFEIIDNIAEPDADALESLKEIKICKRYSRVPHEQLAILTSLLLVRNP